VDLVDLHVYEVEQTSKLGLLTKLLKDSDGAFLVFARTKHGTDKLAKLLAHAGVNAARIHGDRTQGQRNQALDGFKRGMYRVLVATDVAARGIHVDGIAHVVNYDLPMVPEDFIHRAGRTGRMGARGIASTFSTRAERGAIRRIERELSIRMQPRALPAGVHHVVAHAAPQFEESLSKVIVLPVKPVSAYKPSYGAQTRSFGGKKFAPRKRQFAGR
jgi:ATP-dependent RNA helicase RhlE